jgi:hypothetical protein
MNAAALLKPGGFLQTTFIAKEFQDIFWRDDPCYDRITGCWYAESHYHENKRCKPLGYRQIGSEKKAFYRKMNCFTREDAINLMSRAGFTIQSIKPLIYSTDYVLERWSSKYHFMEINERQMELLREWNGYKDGWSVKAVLAEPSPS